MIFTALAILIAVVAIVWYCSNLRKYDDCTVLQTIDLSDAVVEIVNDGCKEGLPHTTGPHTIRMTRSVWEGPRRYEILAHERVHLAQKSRSAAEWRQFYTDAWGYTCLGNPPTEVPAELVARLRPNPDTADSPWAIWRGRWLFFPAFRDDGTLRGAEVIVWDLENHRQIGGPPESWQAAFCGSGRCPHQYEHPHEISAEWLAGGRASTTAPAAAKLFAWKK